VSAVEDLAAWLTQTWDEEEQRELAKRTWRSDAPPMDVTYDGRSEGVYVSNPGSSIEHWMSAEDYDRSYLTPAPDKQVLARIAADRKILALHSGEQDWPCQVGNYVEEPCETRLLLASRYQDRPGFRPEWLVERQGVEE